jgi:hypothetical protein
MMCWAMDTRSLGTRCEHIRYLRRYRRRNGVTICCDCSGRVALYVSSYRDCPVVSSCHTLSVWFVCLSPRFADTKHIMCITNTAQNTVEILSNV